MASGAYGVTPEDVQTAGSFVQQKSEEIEQILGVVRSRVDALQAIWSGLAHENMQAQYQEWDSGARQLQDALTGISQKLQSAANIYAEVEQKVSTTFK